MESILTNTKNLTFTEYRKVKLWDYYSLTNQDDINSDFPIVKLKEVLYHRKGSIKINDFEYYKRCRVQYYGNGIKLRDEIKGVYIKTKRQQLCKEDDFLVAEIDAKFGGYGIVPRYLENAIVSSHYFLFEIDKQKLLPDFLAIVIKLEPFAKQVKSTGSTNYSGIRPNHVLNYKIPLPDIASQQRIIDDYNIKKGKINNLEENIEKTSNYLDEVFNEELNLEFTYNDNYSKNIFFEEYSNLRRWDIWNTGNLVISNYFDFKDLNEVVLGKPQYGANVKGIGKVTDTRYIRITDINEDGTLNDDFVSAEEVDEQYILDDYDFLIARSGNTVGKTFLYTKDLGRAIYAGYLIRFKLNLEKIDPWYLFYYTKSKAFKLWISNNQRVTGQPNINSKEFLKAPIIIPDLLTQLRIVEKVNKVKKKYNLYKIELKELETTIKHDLQKLLFNI